MKMTVMIVDNEPEAIVIIENFVRKIPELDLVASYSDPFKARDRLRIKPVNLLFLDIQMDGLNGLELAAQLNEHTAVIFCTNFREFAVEGFTLDAVDYLLKPILFDRFYKAVKKAEARLLGEKPRSLPSVKDDYIFIQVEAKARKRKVDLHEIVYIEAIKNGVKITLNNDVLKVSKTLGYFEEELPDDRFMRIHKSFLISVPHVREYGNGFVRLRMKEDKLIPVSNAEKVHLELLLGL